MLSNTGQEIIIDQKSISVAVVTYNASSYVLETLESIFKQTFAEIHLIISDDGSQDKTLDLVNEWKVEDRVKDRFLSIQILTVPVNTGVSANCNRIIQASKTDWIKFIAGDDILLPNCIEDNMAFVAANSEVQVLFSQVMVYQDSFEEKNYVRTTPENFPNNLFHSNFTAQDQFKILCESDRIHYTPSYMFRKSALEKVGFYDESERFVEDYPMWLKLTQAGIRLHYFHKPTVGYRIHAKATNNTGEVLFKPSVINSYKVRKKYAHPNLPRFQVKQETWAYYVSILFFKMNWMRPGAWNKLLYRFLTIYGNPFFWMNALKKRIFNAG